MNVKMKYNKCTLSTVVFALVVLIAVAAVSWYAVIVTITNEKLRNHTWWETATLDQQRELCHRILIYRIEDPHDAFSLLSESGDWSSVPILISALKRSWPEEKIGSGSVVCTVDHCVTTLEAITGEDFGYDWREWRKWWKSEGRYMEPPAWLTDPLAVQVASAEVTDFESFKPVRNADGSWRPELLSNSTNVLMREGVGVKIKYRTEGRPQGRLFPVTLKCLHPPVKDSGSGAIKSAVIKDQNICFGENPYYIFLDDDLLLQGTWTFQVWFKGANLCEQSFYVDHGDDTRFNSLTNEVLVEEEQELMRRRHYRTRD
jgi:hypothetical protein